MQPERIQGAAYTVRSDVWSLGITLIELALGRFPFAPDDGDSDDEPSEGEPTLSPVKSTGQSRASSIAAATAASSKPRKASASQKARGGPGGGMSILELLQHVVNEPAPRLPEGRFSPELIAFIDACLDKDVAKRPTPKALLVRGLDALIGGSIPNAIHRRTNGSPRLATPTSTSRPGRTRSSEPLYASIQHVLPRMQFGSLL
jgi:mitogen-activated protein kinase kinase